MQYSTDTVNPGSVDESGFFVNLPNGP